MKSQWLIITVLFPIEIFSRENLGRIHLHTIALVSMTKGEHC